MSSGAYGQALRLRRIFYADDVFSKNSKNEMKGHFNSKRGCKRKFVSVLLQIILQITNHYFLYNVLALLIVVQTLKIIQFLAEYLAFSFRILSC